MFPRVSGLFKYCGINSPGRLFHKNKILSELTPKGQFHWRNKVSVTSIPPLKLSNGFNIPAIGLGTFECKDNAVEVAINAAIDCGYRHFDTAHLYENEKEVGDSLRKRIEDGTVKREDLFVTTKLWNKFHHPDDVERACLDSRDKFGLGYIDLFLMHWPLTIGLWDDSENPDDSIDYLDTWKAMQSMVDKGYVKSLGVSNFNHKQLERILSCKDLVHKPVCHQVAIRWGLQRGYSVIPKSATPSRIRENIQVFDFDLTEDEMKMISKLNRNFRFFHFDYSKNSIYYPFNEEY